MSRKTPCKLCQTQTHGIMNAMVVTGRFGGCSHGDSLCNRTFMDVCNYGLHSLDSLIHSSLLLPELRKNKVCPKCLSRLQCDAPRIMRHFYVSILFTFGQTRFMPIVTPTKSQEDFYELWVFSVTTVTAKGTVGLLLLNSIWLISNRSFLLFAHCFGFQQTWTG